MMLSTLKGFRAQRTRAGIAPTTRGLGKAVLVLLLTLSGALLFASDATAQQGGGSAATQVAVPGRPAPERIQPWGLPPPPPDVGPVSLFADIHDTPQGKFLEGGAFDEAGNFWFVAIGSGWISYLTPQAKLVPVVNCNPPSDIGFACEPQGTRWHDGKLYLTTRHLGILVYDPTTKKLSSLVATYRNQLFKGPNDLDFDAEGNLYFTDPWGTGPGPDMADRMGAGPRACSGICMTIVAGRSLHWRSLMATGTAY
jgi:gluconolactonase